MANSLEASVKPRVSVVIVNWNARDDLVACLASLRLFPPNCSWEAIVIDNGSSDGSVEAVQQSAPWARIIANKTNRGLSAANNQGMMAALGEYFLIANPDVLFATGSIDALCSGLDRYPRAGIAIPQIVQANGELQTSVGTLPNLREALVGSVVRGHSRETSGFWWHGWSHAQEMQVGHGAEACYLVRRDAVVTVGSQDEHFTLDWEGIEWSARMEEAGYEIWFIPSSRVTHIGGTSIKQAPVRWIVSSHRGMYRYFRLRVHPALRPALAAIVAMRAGLKLAWRAVDPHLYERAHRRARSELP